MSELTFASLELAEPLLRALADTGYTHPTPIQAQAIPQVLKGGDLLAAAQTGTGKTAGFTLPILQRLMANGPTSQPGAPRVLILAPTRELAAQVEESVKTYSKYLPFSSMVMFGGVSIKPQQKRLAAPVDILVATPGRLLDHAGTGTLDLSAVEILVLDEADRMLDMGFIHDIKKVLKLLPAERQNLLFSATFSDEIKALADKLLNNPQLVEVARRNTTNELITQRVHLVDRDKKLPLLTQLIKEGNWHQVLVFMRTKHACNRVAEKLAKEGITAMAIHGNKSQNARTAALAQFKSGELQVLVATDIAARGLDIEELPHVVNLELPNVPEDYVHRIGRTGRAGCTGEALSLVCVDELEYLKNIEKLIKQSIEQFTVPGFEADLSVKPEPIVRGGLGRDRPQRQPRNRKPAAARPEAGAPAVKSADATETGGEQQAAGEKPANRRNNNNRRRKPAPARQQTPQGNNETVVSAAEGEQPRRANPSQNRNRRPQSGQNGQSAAGNGQPRPPRSNEEKRPQQRRPDYDERQPDSNANALPFEMRQRNGRNGRQQQHFLSDSFVPQGGYFDAEERRAQSRGNRTAGNRNPSDQAGNNRNGTNSNRNRRSQGSHSTAALLGGSGGKRKTGENE